MSLLSVLTILSCTYIVAYTTSDNGDLNVTFHTAHLLWNESLQSFETESYVYGLQQDCGGCTQCEKEPKHIIVNYNSVQKVQYDNEQSECIKEAPLSTNIYTYKTMQEWFELLKQPGHHATYDETYGFPTNIFGRNDDGMSKTQILCVSFLKQHITLNTLDNNHCPEYILNDTLCEPDVIQKENCTQWLYVYTTTGSTLMISTLSILCFWMYYRQNDPSRKGYKRSRRDDFVNDNSDSDCGPLHGDDLSKKRKRRSKLLGIDENKVIPKIRIKKNISIKYGSIAQTDEDEKCDNPFDLDVGSDRSDEWHFVSDNKNDDKKEDAASHSDQTDEEQED